MAYGAVFINDAGKVQIDETTPCLSLMSSGSQIAGGQVLGSPTTRSYALTVNGGTAPLLAIGVDAPSTGDKGFQVVEATRSGSTFAYTIFVWHSHGTDFAFRWYVFDVPYGTTATGWGMVVRDGAGRIVFNSNYPPARSVSAMAAGRKYAAIYMGVLGYQENASWDTEEQQEIIQWELNCAPLATYPGAGSMSGFVDGREDFQPPTIPWPTSTIAGSDVQIMLDVTGYPDGSGGLPPGYDWLVHPTTGEQLTWGGENLVWPT